MPTALVNSEHYRSARENAPRRSVLPRELTVGWIAALLLGHAVYGLVLARSGAVATVHAILTLALGLWLAATSTMWRVAIVCAYIAGCEILWRIGGASIPWEFAKYSICLLVLITLGRVNGLRWNWLAMAYFGLLVPSTILSFSEHDFDFARKQVSFNLSGPLTLALTTWFFVQLRPSRAELQRLFLAFLAPIASLAAIALTHTASLENLNFSAASNFQTSAGYGPNQVSTVFGFGLLLALLMAFLVERGGREKITYGILAVLLAAQSALTFSRGGLFSAFGALVIAGPFLIQGSRSKVTLVFAAVLFVAAADFIILPRLDAFTGGALSARFQDTSPTGRDELIRTELETFVEHPIFGTGPAALDNFGSAVTSTHTEFTRLPSQHGVFGLAALAMMCVLAWGDVARQQSWAARAISVALIAWSLLTMGHAAMRLALAPFAFGLAAAAFLGTKRTRPDFTATAATIHPATTPNT